MNLGKELQELRTKNNISQEAMAEKLNVSRQTISNWENSKSYPDILLLIQLCDVYGISLDDLIKGDEKLLKSIEKDKKRSKKLICVFVFTIIILSLILVYSLYFKNIINTNKSINREVNYLLENNNKFVTIFKSKSGNRDEMTDNYIKITDSEYKKISSYLDKNKYKYELVYRFTNFHKESTDTMGYVYHDKILGINNGESTRPFTFWASDYDIVRIDDFSSFFEKNIIGRTPINSNEIIISNALANQIIEYGIGDFYPKNYDEIIEYNNYYMLNNKIKIVGIINYDLSAYDCIKDITWEEINKDYEKYKDINELYLNNTQHIYNKIYVGSEFIPNLKIDIDDATWDINITRVGIMVIENNKNKLIKLLKHFNNDIYEVKDSYNILE